MWWIDRHPLLPVLSVAAHTYFQVRRCKLNVGNKIHVQINMVGRQIFTNVFLSYDALQL